MIYTYPSYVPGIAVAIAVLLAAIGALLLWRRKPLTLALIVFGVSAVAGGIVAPMLAMSRVVLDDQKLEETTGFWFAPTKNGFRLADVAFVTIRTAANTHDELYKLWIVKMKNGQTREIDPSDLWDMNAGDIIERLKEKGIEVRGSALK